MTYESLNKPYEALHAYLVSGSDQHLCVLPDGSWYTKPYNTTEIDPEGTVYLNCHNVGDLDSTWWTEGFADRREDGLYYEICSGLLIGDLEDVISRCIKDGDVEGYLADLEREIAEARKEVKALMDMYPL